MFSALFIRFLLTFRSFFFQKYLSDAWITTLGMRKSVALKRFQLQLFRNNWKLMTVLKGQVRTVSCFFCKLGFSVFVTASHSQYFLG